jgi:ribulose-phosphate 3-epimerase
MSIRIAPSILAADFANLESEMAQVSTADLLHVDVMDGHFVPNLTIGIPVVKRLAEVSPLPLDVHLMIEDPDRWAPRYAELGAASVTFHFEAARDPRQCAADIKSTGARAAVAIKPGTPADAVMSLIEHVDMVLVMTVEPGFGGQSFMPETLPKLATLKAAAEQAGTALWLQVDGVITDETAPDEVDAGADTLVAGSSVFGPSDRAEAIQAIRNACQH